VRIEADGSVTPIATGPAAPWNGVAFHDGNFYVAAGGQNAANQMCGLSGTQIPIEPSKLQAMYKTPKDYAASVEKRVKELEKAGWSLPIYRDVILSDAQKVRF